MDIQADASTVIMKTLSNNKGISLIILIIAMTLIAILGASFVSLVGTKHRGFLYQNDSCRALNLANSGVEYAIRYVGDSISLSPNTNDFYHNPSSYPNVPVVSTVPDTTNLTTAQWKKIDFPDGKSSFYLSYYLDVSNPDDYDNNKMLYSVGVSGGAQRILKIKKFLSYASPSITGLGLLNLVPNSRPTINGNYVVVPLMNLYGTNVNISSIELEANLTNNLTKELQYIYVRDNNQPVGATLIYSYASYPDDCFVSYVLPCKFDLWPWQYIEIPDNGPKTKPLVALTGVNIPGHAIRWFFFRFSESGSDLRGVYEIKFNLSTGDSSTLRFNLPYP